MPHYKYSVRIPIGLGLDETVVPMQAPVDALQAQLKAQEALLNDVKGRIEEELTWRKIATIGTLIGTAIAAVRLTEIWVTIRRRG